MSKPFFKSIKVRHGVLKVTLADKEDKGWSQESEVSAEEYREIVRRSIIEGE